MAPITTQKTIFKVSDFLSWQRSGSLVLSPQFQRNSVWKSGTKSYLIDTIVRGFPIPIIFLRDRLTDFKTFEPKREVVDGQQRLRTVIAYVAPSLVVDFEDRDDFTVRRSHNLELAGKRFSELSQETQRKILDYEFSVHVLSPDVDDREVLQIFRRMNSSNYALNPQEVRNSQWFGEFKTSMYSLAEEQLGKWRSWKTFTIDDIARMQEVELTTEFCLMIIDKTIQGKSKARIDNAYEEYDESFLDRIEVENRFRTVMDTLDEKFGDEFFHSPFSKKTIIYSIFAVFYDLLFGLETDLKKAKPSSISPEQVASIKLAGERIQKGTAPNEILEAASRRTTNPKERKVLTKYILHATKSEK
jgi:hypothetical protein